MFSSVFKSNLLIPLSGMTGIPIHCYLYSSYLLGFESSLITLGLIKFWRNNNTDTNTEPNTTTEHYPTVPNTSQHFPTLLKPNDGRKGIFRAMNSTTANKNTFLLASVLGFHYYLVFLVYLIKKVYAMTSIALIFYSINLS